MNDANNTTPAHGLTTDQIAAAGARPAQDDVLAPDGHDYDDSFDDSYDNAVPLAADEAVPGYTDRATTDVNSAAGANGGTGVNSAAGVNGGSSVTTGAGPHASLLDDSELQSITMRWKDIQAEFVDEPAEAVQEADALVAELMQRLAAMFATERAELETRWSGTDEVSTEDLRQGLRRYRSFFERLLAA
jgi:hypothetical protein